MTVVVGTDEVAELATCVRDYAAALCTLGNKFTAAAAALEQPDKFDEAVATLAGLGEELGPPAAKMAEAIFAMLAKRQALHLQQQPSLIIKP